MAFDHLIVSRQDRAEVGHRDSRGLGRWATRRCIRRSAWLGGYVFPQCGQAGGRLMRWRPCRWRGGHATGALLCRCPPPLQGFLEEQQPFFGAESLAQERSQRLGGGGRLPGGAGAARWRRQAHRD